MKRGLRLGVVALGGWLMSSSVAFAQVNTNYNFILGNASPIELLITIINWSLGLLALIALCIIIWGGFTWLLSRGNEETIERAKAILRNGLIGLVIILTAWGLAQFIVNLFLDLTGATENYSTPYSPYEPSSGSPFYLDHTNPADGDTDVPLCHIIAATFSYPLNQSSVNDDSFKVTIPANVVSNPTGGKLNNGTCTSNIQCVSGQCSNGSCVGDQVAGSFAFSESGYSAVFYPESDYESGATYHVDITTDVEGIDPETGAVYNLTPGDPKRIFDFTTGNTTDAIPPKVDVAQVTPYPVDGSANICLNPTLQVSFSESLDPASPSDQNVWLYQADLNGDGVVDAPSDQLDINPIRSSSIGGNADDTIVTSPSNQLASNTDYGISLYSGNADTARFDGAIYDTCGNPLSGNFDDNMTGSPTDDFTESTSAGLDQAYCACTSGVDTCQVSVGGTSCSIDAATTCNLGVTCDQTNSDYVGYDYQWIWTTGTEPYCTPDVQSITQQDTYYSEDKSNVLGATGTTGSEDTGKVLVTGNYLYPFYDTDFYNNISAAGLNCFDANFHATLSCFISNVSDTSITFRTPVASQTGRLSVENSAGSDTSADILIIDSPYILNTSPLSGPPGQFITIRGRNFVDYDPTDSNSSRGRVYFDGIEAEVRCDDGWDDDQIIVSVPSSLLAGATPHIQVVTAAGKHSNEEGFTVTDGEPGPGICELIPNCSDTGLDDVTILGENFGTTGTVYFSPSDGSMVEGSVRDWNVYNTTEESYSVLTNQTPITTPDDYTVFASNTNYYSNGLPFDITCSVPPTVLEYYQCNPDSETVYLPNPRGFEDNACVNSVGYFAFTNDMDDASVQNNVQVYKCNYGTNYDDTTCTTVVTGSYVPEFLSNAYRGGDGTVLLDGTTDANDDGKIDIYDAYQAYTFYPDTALAQNYFYKVVIPTTVTNANGVPLASEYSWNFHVRNDGANCVADNLSLAPMSQLENSYSASNACLDNYSYTGTSYTFHARPSTDDCIVLDDAGDYQWDIVNPSGKTILGFGDNSSNPALFDTVTSAVTDNTTRGYNTVCLQGADQTNSGDAVVTANLLDPNDPTNLSAAIKDDAYVTVDFGYCTQDSDCYTQECRDTYCDPTTSHCAVDITGFSPDNGAGTPDVGPGGCVTVNGCYFGPDQTDDNTCTCTSVSSPNATCTVLEGDNNCLLPDRSSVCSLGETTCDLGSACSATAASADYSTGVFSGCTCSVGAQTCTVTDGESTCVADGNASCSATLAVSNGTWQAGATGSVNFVDSASTAISASYPSAAICGDVWNDNQVIVQVPSDGSVPAGDYGLSVNSYYGLSDLYSQAAGDSSDCTVGADATACLCQADPAAAQETDLITLYGYGFDILTRLGNEQVSFKDALGRVTSDGSETWNSNTTEVNNVVVPAGAITDTAGVQLTATGSSSNAIDFSVSCASNLDCATGCCNAGQCSAAETCNTCVNDIDCMADSCQSTCVDGMCAPVITSLSPDTGAVGQPVTIQGCYFGSYYDPINYPTTYSKVTVAGITAPLACTESESWNNQQIIVTMPSGTFGTATAPTTTADVTVDQVITKNAAQVARTSNAVAFTPDNSCSTINLPVLCQVSPAYGPYSTVPNTTLTGSNFYGQSNDGYCSCNLATLGSCTIDAGYVSCAKTLSTQYYVNPSNTTEKCSDGSGTTASTLNAYTTYDPASTTCVYVDPTNSSITCSIAVGQASCTISTPETCYADDSDHNKACSSAIPGFVALDGAVDYYNAINATIDWTNSTSTNYLTNVPSDASTGDITAIATTATGTQCTSNGINFPVTCNSCGDCSNSDTSLNCNLGYDQSFGACTADTTGFCRDNAGSCCNNTSCVYDDSVSSAVDGGTCASQPLIVLDDAVTTPQPGDTNVCANAQIQVEFSEPITTSAVFPLNDNRVDVTDPNYDESIDLTANDVLPENINFEPYVRLRLANVADTDTATSLVQDIALSADQKTLTITLDQILDYAKEYEVIVDANPTVAGGTNYQYGIVSQSNGVAVGCSAEQVALGMCDSTNGLVKLSFTTADSTFYNANCVPSYTDLEASDQDFIDANYTYTADKQKEAFIATVYANGADATAYTDDDQAIQRIDDGSGAGFYWNYTWDPIYATFVDLENDVCPVAGIISGGDTGSCSCDITEKCDITLGATSCTTGNGVTCTTDSPNEVCDTLDSGYSSANGTCACTMTDSCTMAAGEASCTVDISDATVSCPANSSSGVCDADDSEWSAGGFVEDKAQQTVQADSPTVETPTDSVTTTVTGDGSVEQGWGNTLTDSVIVTVQNCSDASYLTSYDNSDYNFYWSYCRGSDPQSSSFLPTFEEIYQRSDVTVPSINDIYGSQQDFIYEVAFKDPTALTNDVNANNNTIAIRVYPNDLDGDQSTVADSTDPNLWLLLNANNTESSASLTTIDGYQAVSSGATTYIAATNLQGSSLRPYIFVIAYSNDANAATKSVVQELLKNFQFNRNNDLSNNCALEKTKIIHDTKRINDLGTLAYVLSSYYYNDSDGNAVDDFPALAEGSYIPGVTNSLWPSWDATLGNALGQSLPKDPVNEFYDAANSCPYNPPDLAAGETTGTYYDESGTCWDPVLKDFYGPAESSVYQYQYQSVDQFSMYARLEYAGAGTWQEQTYDPCRYYNDGTTPVSSSVSDFSNAGCATFNYSVDASDTTDNTTYADQFSS